MTLPSVTLVSGAGVSVAFHNCVISQGSGSVVVNGSLTMTFDNVAGVVTSTAYTVDARINLDAFSFADDTGIKTVQGDLRFVRNATTASDKSDLASSLVGKTLSLTWSGEDLQLTSFSVQSLLSGSLFTLGPANATLVRSGIGTLQASIGPSNLVQGPTPMAPNTGVLQVAASDSTSANATVLSDSSVRIDVDTNGDGSNEGVLTTTWDALLY